jgi:uncharacterized membrane-anchored protein YitT (DUF2179 family)
MPPRQAKISVAPGRRHIWRSTRRFLLLFIGVMISALGYSLFQVPFNLAAGGVSGISIIIAEFTGWRIGAMILLMNVPLWFLGYHYLGGWRFLWRTIAAVVIFSAAIDLFNGYLPQLLDEFPITDDILLSALYGGIIGGIGGGLVYRAGGTMGGTSIVGRILQLKTGTPLSQIYFYTDGLIILVAGLVFGWEVALYALLTLFLNGLASDYTLEGPSSVRTATIITDRPDKVARALIDGLGRGVSQWEITGAYTGQSHTMLLCTVYRPQVNELKELVAESDREAFVTIGTAHQALGFGFSPLRK